MATESGRFIASETTNLEEAMAEGKFGPGRGFGKGLFADRGEGVRALVEEVVQSLIGSEVDEHFGGSR